MRHMVCSCGAVVQFEAAWLDCRVVSAATDTLVACWMALCVPFASSSPPFALYYLNTAIHDGTAACNGCWAFASSSRFLTVFEMYGGFPDHLALFCTVPFSHRVVATFSFIITFACMPRPLCSPLFLSFSSLCIIVIALHYYVDLSDSDKEVALICSGSFHLAICTTGQSLLFGALGRALPTGGTVL